MTLFFIFDIIFLISISQEQSVVIIKLNGVTIDSDVILKDDAIEMNNNVEIKDDSAEISEPILERTEIILSDNDNGNILVEQENSPEEESTTVEELGCANIAGESEIQFQNSEIKAENENKDENGSKDENDEKSVENATNTETDETIEHNEKSSEEESKNDEKSSEQTVIRAESCENELTEHKDKEQTENEQEDSVVKMDSSKLRKKSQMSVKKTPKKSKKQSQSQHLDKLNDDDKLDNYMISSSPRQRRYYLHLPRGYKVKMPGDECEIFCSNIPINVLEYEIIPLFERYGKIFELRLLMSRNNPNRNAGFAFIRFMTSEAATEATRKLDKYEILPGKLLSIRLSQPNLSLFVGNIHRGLTRDQIHEKMNRRTKGLVRTFVKNSYYEETKNCGFCFLEYESHQSAANAKRLLNNGNVWGRHLFVDWAQRRTHSDDDTLEDSKTVFINYLPKATTEEQLQSIFSAFGSVDRITKIKDYAFILYTEHNAAVRAINEFNKNEFGNNAVEISMAMPKIAKKSTQFTPLHPMTKRFHRSQQFFGYKQHFGSTYNMRKRAQTGNPNNTKNVKVRFAEKTQIADTTPAEITEN